MAEPFKIVTTSMSIRFKVGVSGSIFHSPSYLDVSLLLKEFTVWDYNYKIKRFIPGKKYRYYDFENFIIHLPRYFLNPLTEYLKLHGVDYEIIELEPCYGKDIDIELIPGFTPRDDRQKDAIDFLNNSDLPLKGISLQTGVGKTVVSIAHICHKKKRALIGVDGLIDQWINEVKKWTNIKDEDIYVIKGAPSLVNLLNKIDRRVFPKIIFYSAPTLRKYAQNDPVWEEYGSFDSLVEKLNIGIRIIDESHKSFHTNLMQSLRLNVRDTIALTATFDITDQRVKKIFDRVYPRDIRYGESNYKSYVNITAYGYKSGSRDLNPYIYTARQAYSHVKFETWLLSDKRIKTLDYIIYTTYVPIIKSHYISKRKPGQKLLILVSTIDMCNHIVNRLVRVFPTYKIDSYHGESDDSVFDLNDIIVSTVMSSGTGRDIKNLLTVLQTISIASSVQNIQNLGRLRELEDGSVPEFCYTFNVNIPKQIEYHNVRKNLFTPRSLSFTERYL